MATTCASVAFASPQYAKFLDADLIDQMHFIVRRRWDSVKTVQIPMNSPTDSLESDPDE